MTLETPIYWRSKILLAGIEATYGTDPVPTGAANAILATNVTLSPMEGNDVSRDLERPYFGAQPTVPTELHAKLTYDVELAPSGTAGTPPGWGPLLRACGVAETINVGVSVVYNPITDSPESATHYVWIGGTLYKITGCRGTATFKVNAQGVPTINFQFQGLFTTPTETARVTPDLTGFKKPLVATSVNTPTFTVGGTAFVLRTFAMAMGNTIENRFLIGSESVLITDRAETIDATVQAVKVSTFDPFTLAENETTQDVELVHGTGAGAIATLSAPTAQMQRLQGLQNAQNILEWPLRLVPLPAAGNDQWTLTLT